MKIAYVCADPGVPVFGCKGCSLHVQEMLRALRNKGASVHLLATRTGGNAPADLADLPVQALPAYAGEDEAARERAQWAANAGLTSAVRSLSHLDLVYERYSLWSHAGLEVAREAGIATVLEVNAPLIEEQQQFRQLHDPVAALASARRAFSAADVLVAVSDGVAAYLQGFPEARGRVHVIANGVDTERFVSQPTLIGTRPFTIGFVGTLKPWHGVDVLLRAFARFHADNAESRLLIVGHGPERERLDSLVVELDVAHAVEFTGAVTPSLVPSMLARMDVGVAPYPESADFYFSPLKVYEYMAAGLVVVASRIGQLEGLIRDGEDGVLCPPGDAEALAASFVQVSSNPDWARALGDRARHKMQSAHTWSAVAHKVLNLAASSRRATLEVG